MTNMLCWRLSKRFHRYMYTSHVGCRSLIPVIRSYHDDDDFKRRLLKELLSDKKVSASKSSDKVSKDDSSNSQTSAVSKKVFGFEQNVNDTSSNDQSSKANKRPATLSVNNSTESSKHLRINSDKYPFEESLESRARSFISSTKRKAIAAEQNLSEENSDSSQKLKKPLGNQIYDDYLKSQSDLFKEKSSKQLKNNSESPKEQSLEFFETKNNESISKTSQSASNTSGKEYSNLFCSVKSDSLSENSSKPSNTLTDKSSNPLSTNNTSPKGLFVIASDPNKKSNKLEEKSDSESADNWFKNKSLKHYSRSNIANQKSRIRPSQSIRFGKSSGLKVLRKDDMKNVKSQNKIQWGQGTSNVNEGKVNEGNVDLVDMVHKSSNEISNYKSISKTLDPNEENKGCNKSVHDKKAQIFKSAEIYGISSDPPLKGSVALLLQDTQKSYFNKEETNIPEKNEYKEDEELLQPSSLDEVPPPSIQVSNENIVGVSTLEAKPTDANITTDLHAFPPTISNLNDGSQSPLSSSSGASNDDKSGNGSIKFNDVSNENSFRKDLNYSADELRNTKKTLKSESSKYILTAENNLTPGDLYNTSSEGESRGFEDLEEKQKNKAKDISLKELRQHEVGDQKSKENILKSNNEALEKNKIPIPKKTNEVPEVKDAKTTEVKDQEAIKVERKSLENNITKDEVMEKTETPSPKKSNVTEIKDSKKLEEKNLEKNAPLINKDAKKDVTSKLKRSKDLLKLISSLKSLKKIERQLQIKKNSLMSNKTETDSMEKQNQNPKIKNVEKNLKAEKKQNQKITSIPKQPEDTNQKLNSIEVQKPLVKIVPKLTEQQKPGAINLPQQSDATIKQIDTLKEQKLKFTIRPNHPKAVEEKVASIKQEKLNLKQFPKQPMVNTKIDVVEKQKPNLTNFQQKSDATINKIDTLKEQKVDLSSIPKDSPEAKTKTDNAKKLSPSGSKSKSLSKYLYQILTGRNNDKNGRGSRSITTYSVLYNRGSERDFKGGSKHRRNIPDNKKIRQSVPKEDIYISPELEKRGLGAETILRERRKKENQQKQSSYDTDTHSNFSAQAEISYPDPVMPTIFPYRITSMISRTRFEYEPEVRGRCEQCTEKNSYPDTNDNYENAKQGSFSSQQLYFDEFNVLSFHRSKNKSSENKPEEDKKA